MPLPETCAPAACARVSGAMTVMRAPPLPPAAAATTAVSSFAPVSIVIVWPALKPTALATGTTVAPTSVAAATVVAPGVPTVAMTAVSTFAPRIDRDRLTGGEVGHAGDLDGGRAGGRRRQHGGGGLQQEIGAEVVGVEPVREAAQASVERGRRGGTRSAAAGRRDHGDAAALALIGLERREIAGWRWCRLRWSCSAAIRRPWRRRPRRRSASSKAIEPARAERAPPNH